MVFELIMFTGVIGLACYVIYVLKVMLLATYMFKLTFVLFIATLLTNTIEIVMFNAINIGALCYILWGFISRMVYIRIVRIKWLKISRG